MLLYRLILALVVLGSLSLLIGSLRRAEDHRGSRGRAALAGALGLLWVACRFYWHSHDLYKHSYWGVLRASSVAVAFYLVWRLVAGAAIAMLTFVVFPRAARIVLGISAVAFLASILSAVSRSPSRLAFIGGAWSIGLAIPSIVLIWLEAREKNRQPLAVR